MARLGGRNSIFAWIIGILCAAVVVVLAVLALPLLPIGATLFGGEPASEADGPERAPIPGEPRECRDLYGEALWATLRWAPASEIDVSTEQPATSASDVVAALELNVRFTCAWSSERGEISTTYADAPVDTPEVIRSALPELGFGCVAVADRVRCSRSDGETIETIEAGDGRWLSTVQNLWFPEQYATRTADRVWAVTIAE